MGSCCIAQAGLELLPQAPRWWACRHAPDSTHFKWYVCCCVLSLVIENEDFICFPGSCPCIAAQQASRLSSLCLSQYLINQFSIFTILCLYKYSALRRQRPSQADPCLRPAWSSSHFLLGDRVCVCGPPWVLQLPPLASASWVLWLLDWFSLPGSDGGVVLFCFVYFSFIFLKVFLVFLMDF